MKKIHILYLIKNKSGKLLKIGKTSSDNEENRYKQIFLDFGHCNFEESYTVRSNNEEEISTLERILHKSFSKNRKNNYFKDGIGKTEWFEAHILKEVINHIEFLKKNNKNYKNLGKITKKINVSFSIEKKENDFFKIAITFFFLAIISISLYRSFLP